MEVLATIYCGDDYYRKHAKESSLKIAAMVQKLGADVLLCGPCFNYETYGEMAAEVAKVVEEKVQIPAVAAMSIECQEAITRFKDQVDIVKCQKGWYWINRSNERNVDSLSVESREKRYNGLREGTLLLRSGKADGTNGSARKVVKTPEFPEEKNNL